MRGKLLSFKLNLHDIAGLNTQRVFKCDCSGVCWLLFGFASFSSLLSTLDLLGNGVSSLHAAFKVSSISMSLSIFSPMEGKDGLGHDVSLFLLRLRQTNNIAQVLPG